MPWIDENQTDGRAFNPFSGLVMPNAGTALDEPEKPEAKGFFETVKAGFRQENTVVNAIRWASRESEFGDPDPDHNPYDDAGDGDRKLIAPLLE